MMRSFSFTPIERARKQEREREGGEKEKECTVHCILQVQGLESLTHFRILVRDKLS